MNRHILLVLLGLLGSGCNVFTQVPSSLQPTGAGRDTGGSLDNFDGENETEENEFPDLNLGSVENLTADDAEMALSNNQGNNFDARAATGRVARLDVHVPFDFDSEVNLIRIRRWGPFQKPEDFNNQARDLPQYSCDSEARSSTVSGVQPTFVGSEFFAPTRTGDLSLRNFNNNKKLLDGDKDFNGTISEATGESLIVHDRFYVYLFCVGVQSSANVLPIYKYKQIRVLYTVDGYPYPSPVDPQFGGRFFSTVRIENLGCTAEEKTAVNSFQVRLNAPDHTLGPSLGFSSANIAAPAESEAIALRYITKSVGDTVTFSGADTSQGTLNTLNTAAVITTTPVLYSEGVQAQNVLNELRSLPGSVLVNIPFKTKAVVPNQTIKNTVDTDYKGDPINGATMTISAELILRDLSQNKNAIVSQFGTNNFLMGSSITDIITRGFSETPHFKGLRAIRKELVRNRCP